MSPEIVMIALFGLLLAAAAYVLWDDRKWVEVERKPFERIVILDDGGYGWLPITWGVERGDEIVFEHRRSKKRRSEFEVKSTTPFR